jgi:hypothetical protein
MRRLALVLLSALALGSCGGGSSGSEPLTHDEYQAAIGRVQRDAAPADRLFFDIVAGEDMSVAECGEKTRQFQRELQKIVDEVDRLDPPDDVAGIQARFLDAARESVESVGVTAEDAANGSVRCGFAINKRIYGLASTERARLAAEELEQHGYFVFGE